MTAVRELKRRPAKRPAPRTVTVTGKGYRPTRYRLGRWRMPALLFVGFYLAVGAILPAVVLVWTSFSGGSNESLNLDAYRALFADRRFWPAVGNAYGAQAMLVTPRIECVAQRGSVAAMSPMRRRAPPVADLAR